MVRLVATSSDALSNDNGLFLSPFDADIVLPYLSPLVKSLLPGPKRRKTSFLVLWMALLSATCLDLR